MKPHLQRCWCIPPQQNAAFVAAMEDVLDVYCLPYDAAWPVVCMDETNKQLVGETRQSLPTAAGQSARYDVEYERCGVANLFLFTEPLGGWRRVTVTEHRTRPDWARQIRHLLEVDYPDAVGIRLVMDNLNTHGIASLYEAFDPVQARGLAKRLDLHYTPKHGSWLNIAEIELAVLARQCLDRRIDNSESLQHECSAWDTDRNQRQTGVDWQFTTDDARIKLKRLYPQMKE